MRGLKIKFKRYDKDLKFKIFIISIGVIFGVTMILGGSLGKLHTDYYVQEGTFVSFRVSKCSGKMITMKLPSGGIKEFCLPHGTSQDFDMDGFKDNVQVGDKLVLTIYSGSKIAGIKDDSRQYLTPENTTLAKKQNLATAVLFGCFTTFISLAGVIALFEIKRPNQYRRSRHHR